MKIKIQRSPGLYKFKHSRKNGLMNKRIEAAVMLYRWSKRLFILPIPDVYDLDYIVERGRLSEFYAKIINFPFFHFFLFSIFAGESDTLAINFANLWYEMTSFKIFRFSI